MDASALLAEYAARHDACRARGDFAPLAALFAEDGEIRFSGVNFPALRGRGDIERAFRDRGPDDDLVLGRVLGGPPGHAHAVFGWRAAPDLVAGTLRLAARDATIARLDVIAVIGGPQRPRPREAVRAIVVTPDPRVLLLRCREPKSGASWWITPGGGIEPGEAQGDAMRRELAEEVGVDVDLGTRTPVWTREHVFTWGDHAVRQREWYFLVDVPETFPVVPQLTSEGLAAEGLGESRWWTLDELREAELDVFAPRRLAALVEALVRDGPPSAPVDVGV